MIPTSAKQGNFQATPGDENLKQEENASHSFDFQMLSEAIFPVNFSDFMRQTLPRTACCRYNFASLCDNN